MAGGHENNFDGVRLGSTSCLPWEITYIAMMHAENINTAPTRFLKLNINAYELRPVSGAD